MFWGFLRSHHSHTRLVTSPHPGEQTQRSLILPASREMSSLCWNAQLLYANLQKQMSSRHCCWSPDVHLRYLGLFSEHHISERERARDGDGLQRCVALYGRTSGQLLNCRVPRTQLTANSSFMHVTLTWLSRQPIGIPLHLPVLHQRMEFSLTWDGFGKEVMS